MAFRIEMIRDVAGCSATVPIQEETWSGDVTVPPQLMLAVIHNGGFAALGYVEGDERLAGFVFGFLGIYDYHFRHHSHMLAVRPPYRHTGLALALKEAQRDHCLDQGIDTIAWTMDPLEARNARFNFSKLGTFAHQYHRDFYGDMPDKLNEGLPSDRLYVEWRIATDHVAQRLRGERASPSLESAESEGVAYLLRAEGGSAHDERPLADSGPSGEAHVLLGVPSDIQALKARDRGLALEWRHAARDAFERGFRAGYAAVDFLRRGHGRGAYLLVPEPRPGAAGEATNPADPSERP